MGISSSIKSILKPVWKAMFPRQYWRSRFQALTQVSHEPELGLVPYLCDAKKTSVDVGAAGGIFSVRMCQASRDVVAYEPRPRQAAELAAMFSSLALPVRVEEVALSISSGTAQMRMLMDDLGRSTIEAANSLEDEDGSSRAEVTVQLRKLDDYALTDVAFVKVDVEGHEVSVLEGASDTIARNQPVLLVESEDRHRKNAVADVTALLKQCGYSGFFIEGGSLCDIDTFRLDKHQDSRNIGGWKSGWARRGIYVNNFFFVPKGREAALEDAFRKWTKLPSAA